MSLLDDASLVLVPSGYKANKVYSQIPTNGDGDLTFTRASDATRVNSDGEIEVVGSGVPRLDYSQGSCPALLLEPQRTNLVFPSGTGSTQTRTVAAVAHTLSFFGTGTVVLSGVAIATLTGTGANNRATLTFTPTAGSLTLTVTGTVTRWQLEQGAYPTSYIPTTNATVTRLVDTFIRNNIFTNGLISASGGTWYIEINNNFVYTRDGSQVGIFIANDTNGGVSTDGLALRNNGSNGRLSVNKRVATVQTQLYATTTDYVKVALKWNGTSLDVFENGVKVVNATAYTPTIMEYFGSFGGDVPKYIIKSLLFPTPLTDIECIELTTL